MIEKRFSTAGSIFAYCPPSLCAIEGDENEASGTGAAPETAVTSHTDTPGLLTSAPDAHAESTPEAAAPEAPVEAGAQEGTETAAEPAETEETGGADPDAQDEAKPEAPDAPEAEPEAEKPAEPPPPLTYDEPLQLPEGIALDAERAGRFDALIGGVQVPPEVRQQLADMHVETMQHYAEHLAQEQHRVFGETRQGWRQEIMGDPELGGAGIQTNLEAAARMLDKFVPPERRDAFNQALMVTGMTDHPEMFRFLLNVAKAFDEPAAPPMPNGPPKNIGQRNGSFREAMYSHPRSPR